MEQEIQQKLDLASQVINEAQESYVIAQGSNKETMQQAIEQLDDAEKQLESIQNEGGTEVEHNPHFQQAYEKLHDIRQRIMLVHDHNNDVL